MVPLNIMLVDVVNFQFIIIFIYFFVWHFVLKVKTQYTRCSSISNSVYERMHHGICCDGNSILEYLSKDYFLLL